MRSLSVGKVNFGKMLTFCPTFRQSGMNFLTRNSCLILWKFKNFQGRLRREILRDMLISTFVERYNSPTTGYLRVKVILFEEWSESNFALIPNYFNSLLAPLHPTSRRPRPSQFISFWHQIHFLLAILIPLLDTLIHWVLLFNDPRCQNVWLCII